MPNEELPATLCAAKNMSIDCLSWLKSRVKNVKWLSHEDAILLGCYVFAYGLANWMLQRWFLHRAASLYPQWTRGFQPADFSQYPCNVAFVAYVFFILVLIAAVFFGFMFRYFPRLRVHVVVAAEKIWRPVMQVSPVMLIASPLHTSAFAFFVSLLLLGWRRFVIGPVPCKPLSARETYLAGMAMFLIIGGALWLGAASWYPVRISNDYFELSDTIMLPAIDKDNPVPFLKIDRQSIADCLSADPAQASIVSSWKAVVFGSEGNDLTQPAGKPVCHYPVSEYQVDPLLNSLFTTGEWQSQAGRLFYHHSYLFVPIAHILRFGVLSPIPMLYGLGNTLFHAVLMLGKPVSLTNYFNIFPFAQLTGMLAIVACVFYITRSWLSVPAAFAALLLPFWMIGFIAMQMAPGFSPIRYVGVAVQFASVFILLRGTSWLRTLFLFCALAFSFFWNKEFAVFGLFAQLFAVLSPSTGFSPWKRVGLILVMAGMAVGCMIGIDSLSKGFLHTIQVGIYGIALPPITQNDFIKICIEITVSAAVLFYCARRFPPSENAARLCLLPALSLLMIKYIYNSSPVHLYFTLMFIFPVSLVFLDWRGANWRFFSWTPAEQQKNLTLAVLVASAAGFYAAYNFHSQAEARQIEMVGHYVENSWLGLGEDFQTTVPAEPIEARMKALRDEIKPDDVVLFLSPFDHLMSFYANPKKYCGHFEVLTNLVTYNMIDDVTACAEKNPHALVVYDEALEDQCSVKEPVSFFFRKPCEAKMNMIASLKSIMASIKPHMVLVKKVGPLSFYRHAEPKTTNAGASPLTGF